MADFNVRYRYQSRENGSWSSSSISISTRGDENINCKDAREYIISKGRYWDAQIINIELRGSRDYFEYNIRFHYQYLVERPAETAGQS
ncbi:MAG: hypothetical protein K5787_02705 [Lentisphaeria bacterium]|nr:hypothetical protein [Lentisphaeria bacterium]